jgi:hypothetical protein
MEYKINPEFHDLIPPISPEERQLLEESIIKEGCREKIIIWDGCILDGHNRYEICQAHDIPFGIHEMCFENENEAKIWIINNQFSRRNLKPEQMSYLRGVRYNLEKNEPHRPEGKGSQNDHVNLRTAERIAQDTGVSSRTVQRDGEFAEAVDELPPEEKKEILSGKSKKTKKHVTETHRKKTKPKKRKITKKIGPPSDGLMFAKMAILDLEKIQPNDLQYEDGLSLVKQWIKNHERGK